MTTESNLRKARLCATWALAVAAMAACGGGGGDDSTMPAPPPPSSGDPTTPSPPSNPPPSDPNPPAPAPAPPSPPPGAPAAISVNVTGLDGTLTLTTNAGDVVTVSTPGTVAFPTTVPAGDAFTVSVKALPTKQNCVLTNASGIVGTDAVGVSCNTRAWTVGQQLDGDDQPVSRVHAAMDKEGHVTAIFVKGASGQGRLYAVRGTPGAASQAVQWSSSVRLDTDAAPFVDVGFNGDLNFAIAVAPNGDAHAVYASRALCGLGFKPPSSALCTYLYSSVFTAGTGAWSPPMLVSDAATTQANGRVNRQPVPMINDRGDLAIHFIWFVDQGDSGDFRSAMAWRAAGETSFRKRAFADASLDTPTGVLDAAGNMMVAGHRVQSNSSNKDIFWYSGTIASGFPATQGTVIDTLGNDADMKGLTVGPTGDLLLTWEQNDGTGNMTFAASAASATAPWSDPVAFAPRSSGTGFVADNGDAMYYVGCTAYVRPKATGVWRAKAPQLPADCRFDDTAARTGDGSYLTFATGTADAWNTYASASNAMARAGSAALTSQDYLLGFAKNWGAWRQLMYTQKADGNFVGAVIKIEAFDTLPTPGLPSGDGRSGINNLWGFYFK